jgi:acetolactate synthase I/II/III large subunit
LKVAPGYVEDFSELKRNAQRASIDTLGAYGTFSSQLRKLRPRDAIWARDVTQDNTTWGNRVFPLTASEQNVYPVRRVSGRDCAWASMPPRQAITRQLS